MTTPKTTSEKNEALPNTEDTIIRGINFLNPNMRPKAALLAEIMEDIILRDTKGEEYRFRVFETLRPPMRQDHCFAVKTSKARAWQSAHQYGLAVDFAGCFVKNDKWTWNDDLDWKRLKIEAGRVGLIVPIPWDRGHVESLLWGKIRKFVI